LDSLSELGYIHVGYPWRTLKLQPRPALESALVPDWLVLDLFSTTGSGSVTGRININARINDLPGAPAVIRSAPLQALLYNTALLAQTNNIRTNLWAATWTASLPALVTAAPRWGSFSNGYAFAGQVCEVQGVADTGANDVARETNLACVANLITTRSDTFTVWAWGQAMQGNNVVGEAKVQAVVQRLPGNQYRVLYYRYLNQ
jgi:hypothetical protein